MVLLDLGDTFNTLLNLNPGNSGNVDKRAVMVFTSTLRQRDPDLVNGFGLDATQQIVGDQGVLLSGNEFWAQNITNAMPSIAMALNPKSVKFSQPKRFTKKDTRNGSVFFHFTNSKGQNNDILTMSFQGNTGNIDLSGTVDSPERDPAALQSGTAVDARNRVEQDTGALRKLMVWLNLYLMSREPMLLDDGTENEFRITYMSQLFPNPIDFVGFFSKVLDFEENAAKPFSRDYSFDFIVTRTEPDLDECVDHILTYIQTQNNLQPSDTATLIGVNNPLTTP